MQDVRDDQLMRDTFSLAPLSLRNNGKTEESFGLPWLSEYDFQQTRSFQALKVWMNLKYHHLSGYAEAIERDIALAESPLPDGEGTLRCAPATLYVHCLAPGQKQF